MYLISYLHNHFVLPMQSDQLKQTILQSVAKFHLWDTTGTSFHTHAWNHELGFTKLKRHLAIIVGGLAMERSVFNSQLLLRGHFVLHLNLHYSLWLRS